ncbi:MAG TPA: PIN domain-containing protein [Candidatus Limnocylindria bacterium]|nr:PIN domain-containing protein [Candidatus Limnocylindria bacterium]
MAPLDPPHERAGALTAPSLESALPPGARLLLDTSALIAYLGNAEPTTPVVSRIVEDLVGTGRNAAVVSAVSAAELLVGPLRAAAAVAEARVLEFLRGYPNMEVVPVDLAAAQEAARLRAAHRFAMADALVVASGIVRGATVLVTADAAWPTLLALRRPSVSVCLLRSFVVRGG